MRAMFSQVSSPRAFVATAVFCAAALGGMPAQAVLLSTSVTTTLSSPAGMLSSAAPISAALTRTIGGGVEITNGDGSNIGDGFMLNGVGADGVIRESINFFDTFILMRVLGGDPNGQGTGYSAGAKYVFDFDASTPTITGFSTTGSGSDISNIASLGSWVSFSAHQVSFALDSILLVDKAFSDFADITIGLTFGAAPPPTPTVPEPASIALTGLALLCLLGSTRRRPAGSRARSHA